MSAPTHISALLEKLIADARAANPNRPALIGVGGAQGSGKSYQCRAYAAAHPRVAHFSLDDVYLTRAERERQAAFNSATTKLGGPSGYEPIREECPELIPLFTTRGPPGTHDLHLARRLIQRLRKDGRVRIPHFDKLADDRAPLARWPIFAGPADAILVDGWCLGAEIVALTKPPRAPLNAIEQLDTEWLWGRSQSVALLDYAQFALKFDALIFLKAPSWKAICRWRKQQDEELRGRTLSSDEQLDLQRFMMHFERISKVMMLGAHYAGWIVHLDEERNVVRVEQR